MKTWIFLHLAVLCAVGSAQQDCWYGACYPAMGDLLPGREQNLRASSTCGMAGSEVVCTPHGQWKMKCCPCDSRNPGAYNAHTIQNVLTSAGPNRWWQSRKDVSPVTLQFDLNGMYHLETVLLSFKGPRPEALVIERTRDFGRTWTPALYMAADCPSAFPQVDTSLPRNLHETYCYTLDSTADDPYRDQKVHFYPLRQFTDVNLPNEYKIEVVSGFTGLRVNLTQLAHVPSIPGRRLSQFYALREMRVIGSCFCHGHANRCLPDTTSNTQVGGVCECQHNTAGVNCDRCEDLHNDLPWRPAENGNTHACRRCECNNHADRCHFDPARYEATGRRSGGVCEGCMHHTAGPNCERCAPNYYPNPLSNMQSPDACLRCLCNPAGSVDGGECSSVTGECVCKAHVEGQRCDRCKAGHYNLNPNNPLGCSKCSCSSQGSVSDVCDQVTGQCVCRAHVEGLACDRCAAGYWNPSSPYGCQACNCDPTNARSSTCDQRTGQCQCRPGFAGRTCSGCPDNTYGDPLIGCRPCDCDPFGSEPGSCDKRTGACRCRPGVTGVRCDSCSRGHCARFPQCPTCPSCFFTLDDQLQNLKLSLERLTNYIITPSTGSISSDMSRRIRTLQNTLRDIQDTMNLPPQSSRMLTDALERLNKVRSQMKGLDEDLSPPPPSDPELNRNLDELQKTLLAIRLDFFTRRDQWSGSTGSNNSAAFLNAIQKSHDESTDAVKRADTARDSVKNSASNRENAINSLNNVQPVNAKDLQKLTDNMGTRPDLTPAAVKVCGSSRKEPCTPDSCKGDLCPPDGAPSCGRGEPCVGALPNANKAFQDTEEVKDKLQQLNKKITQATTQIQEAQDSANKVRLSTDDLANQIKQVRAEVDEDLRDTKEFINTLKDFLSAPHSDPEQVQRICEGILEAKLPLSLANLKRKLKEMQDLASSLPDSSKILESTKPELEKAKTLLEEAKSTRDAAFGVQQDTESILKTMDESEATFDELEDKIQKSVDIANTVKQDVEKIEESLAPAEKGLVGLSGLVDEMRPLLDGLKRDVTAGTELANDAQNQADSAQKEADRAAKELKALKDEVEMLKQAAAANNQAGETSVRLQELQKETESLTNETTDIMNALRDKESSISQGVKELEENAKRLSGLEEHLRNLRDDIRTKAHRLSVCQG